MQERPRRPIKVMHVIARMNVGGPAVEITELMRGLDPEVISQRLLTGYCNDDEADFLETQAPDIEATRIDGLGRSIRPTDDAKALATLTQVIRASRPEIVHTHTAKAGVLGRLAAKAAGIGTKIVHTHHGHLLHGYFGPVNTKAVIQLERQLSRITDRIVTVGDTVRDELLEAGIGRPDQYIVIRSGPRLRHFPDKDSARLELGVPRGPVVVAMIGRLTRIKRPDRFAEVVAAVRSRHLNVHFLVAGGGDEEQTLAQRVARDSLPVTMLGWCSHVETVLAASDMVLLTSDNEGMPLSLLQAGMAELPVIATDVGSIPELVVSDRVGILCPRDPIALADAIQSLMEEEKRRRMGKALKSVVIHRFSPEQTLVSHMRQYVELQQSRRVGSA